MHLGPAGVLADLLYIRDRTITLAIISIKEQISID
jgi:hypothetical protein